VHTPQDGRVLDDDVWRYLPLGPRATVVAAVLGCAVLVAVSTSTGRWAGRLRWVLLGAAVLAVAAVTLLGSRYGSGGGVNWQLGAGIRGQLHSVNRALGLANVLGNVALFVPVGWLVAAVARRDQGLGRRVVAATCAGLLLSALVETAQHAIGRATDVDDVLLNTAGALVGAVIGAALSSVRSGDPAPGRASGRPAAGTVGP
jgi:uncharacterized membrane protein YfcA